MSYSWTGLNVGRVEPDARASWLVLVHQFPKEPASLRVKIWRRLQGIGAVAVKNSMYVLPQNEQTQEDFEWLLRELVAGGADGAIMEARFIDGMDDQQVRALFDAARDADYDALADEVRHFDAGKPDAVVTDEEQLRESRSQLARYRKKLAAIEAIDFFGANGREMAEGLVSALSNRTMADAAGTAGGEEAHALQSGDFTRRVWVTRQNVHVDRIASAWLIRRFIDPDAVFKFAAGKKYAPGARELRFDMFEAEFSHEGELCTFEVLVSRFGLDDAALNRIGQIVHDIDLKDGRYAHEETAGISHLLAGIVSGTADDHQRIDRGSAMFEDLYRFFRELEK